MHENEKIKRVKQVLWISGIFTALVSLLLILNYLQIRASEPLESATLKMLVERLSSEPDNHALMEEVRQFDLLARKAYFNSLWFIRTGAYLLLIGAIVLVAALRIYFTLRFSIDKPSHELLKEKQKRKKAQRWIASAGATVIILAALSAFFTADHLKQYDAERPLAEATDSGVEQVEISRPATTQIRPEATDDREPTGILADDTIPESDSETAVSGELEDASPVQGEKEVRSAPILTPEAINRNHNAFRGAWGNGISARRNIPTKLGWNIRQ
jgi:outer membrane protein assembly factor BamB